MALIAVLGILLAAAVLWDAFETVVLPRRVSRRLHLARSFFATTWWAWSYVPRRKSPGEGRENYLSYYGPLSLVLLIMSWAVLLVVAFALVHWGFGGDLTATGGEAGFWECLYFSGTTFSTLGLGDIAATTPEARAATVIQSGTGFAFLALAIGYLPVLYQAFSRREINISLLDGRAGSPPSAEELLRRHGQGRDAEAMARLLLDWEHWAAELMESHLSYPVLAYFRSQHERQSWLGGLTVILDVCALIMSCAGSAPVRPARLTFAMARHAAVDLAQVLGTKPQAVTEDRLPRDQFLRLQSMLADASVPQQGSQEGYERLNELRRMYEPYVGALAEHLMMPLPAWLPDADQKDDWETGPWDV